MLENFDKDISVLTESLARSLGRRKMIGTTVKGLTAAIVAATLGQFTNIGQAFANKSVNASATNVGRKANRASSVPPLAAHQTAKSVSTTTAVDGAVILMAAGLRGSALAWVRVAMVTKYVPTASVKTVRASMTAITNVRA